jgi:squalene-hopene/tetraprenyl-beta-curcumene cyclase
VDYLLRTQGPDGNWAEEQFTGTGFPKVFYLKYHMYRLYFPLMALARYARAAGRESDLAPLGARENQPPHFAAQRALDA